MQTVYVFDTVSLGLLAAPGAQTGLRLGFGFWGTVFAGVVSGVDGPAGTDVALLTGALAAVAVRVGSRVAGLALPVPRTPDGEHHRPGG